MKGKSGIIQERSLDEEPSVPFIKYLVGHPVNYLFSERRLKG